MLRTHYKNKYLQFIILVFFTLCLQFIYRSHSMVSRQVKQIKKKPVTELVYGVRNHNWLVYDSSIKSFKKFDNTSYGETSLISSV